MTSSFPIIGQDGVDGSAFQIGDGFAITAGHVVYQPVGSASSFQIKASHKVVDDSRHFKANYRRLVQDFVSSNSRMPTYDEAVAQIESTQAMINKDQVVIKDSGKVNSSDAGLFVSLDRSALLNLGGITGSSTSIQREGQNTGRVSGSILSVTGQGLTFSVKANTNGPGSADSGGVYLVVTGGREYVIGVQSANVGSSAFGTRFDYQEWSQISRLVTAELSGNVTRSEPTNMLVATGGNEALVGTGRADIIIARGGDDTIEDGDSAFVSAAAIASGSVAAGTVWGNDQLFGGLGNDTFNAGMGDDLLHGGDTHLADQPADIRGDGYDTVSYVGLTSVDANSGVLVSIRDSASVPSSFQTFSGEPDFASAIFVTDQGRDKATDTLISIESVILTNADDTVEIRDFQSQKMISTLGSGGLEKIDMGGDSYDETNASTGDLVDFRKLKEGLKIYWSADKMHIETKDRTTDLVSLDIYGAEVFKASDRKDKITVVGNSGTPWIYGAGGNDAIDATFGNINVGYSHGDGLDTLAVKYDVEPSEVNLQNYFFTLPFGDAHGVNTIKFDDVPIANMEFVWKNARIIDSSPGNYPEWLYAGDLYLVEKGSNDSAGINLGLIYGRSVYDNVLADSSRTLYFEFIGLPSISFSDDDFRQGSELSLNVSLRIEQSSQPQPPSSPLAASETGSDTTNKAIVAFAGGDAQKSGASPAAIGSQPLGLERWIGQERPNSLSFAPDAASVAQRLALLRQDLASFHMQGGIETNTRQMMIDAPTLWYA